MAETGEYVVTERAGPRVAGRLAERGRTLTLTAAEAEYELREGTIVPEGEDLAPAFAGSAIAEDLRDDAAAFRARAIVATPMISADQVPAALKGPPPRASDRSPSPQSAVVPDAGPRGG